MILPNLELEAKYWEEGMKFIAGIDEAGRGPLAGPVVAGAVAVYPEIIEKVVQNPIYKLIRDSKNLSFSQREKAFNLITAHFPFGVGWSSHETIDRINIMQATYLAMKKAIADLQRKLGGKIQVVLLDGRNPIPNFGLKQKNIINGDRLVFSISAASVVAKVTRDRMMFEFHEKFPNYDFARHKGYGTKLHFERLEKFGPCEIHRKSFNLGGKCQDAPLTRIS